MPVDLIGRHVSPWRFFGMAPPFGVWNGKSRVLTPTDEATLEDAAPPCRGSTNWVIAYAYSLPCLRPEFEARGILRDGTLDLIGCSLRKVCVDFHGDLEGSLWVTGK